jgi:hypothetical protein
VLAVNLGALGLQEEHQQQVALFPGPLQADRLEEVTCVLDRVVPFGGRLRILRLPQVSGLMGNVRGLTGSGGSCKRVRMARKIARNRGFSARCAEDSARRERAGGLLSEQGYYNPLRYSRRSYGQQEDRAWRALRNSGIAGAGRSVLDGGSPLRGRAAGPGNGGPRINERQQLRANVTVEGAHAFRTGRTRKSDRCRFSRPVHQFLKDQPCLEIRDPEPGEVPTVVPSALHDAYHTSLPAELAKIVGAWAGLPVAVKAGILAMVAASSVRGS